MLAFAFSGIVNSETGWEYQQSTFQAFYMFENLTVDDLPSEGDGCAPNQISGCMQECCDETSCGGNLNTCDVVGAFLNDVCIGWVYSDSQGYTTVPVMGDDGSLFTAGYCTAGSLPIFQVEKANGSLITLTGDIPQWSSNHLFMVEHLTESIELPAVYSLSSAYPFGTFVVDLIIFFLGSELT